MEYKLIANIPYYITGQLLEDFLSADMQPSKMVLMLQKEVVKRIVATDKKESNRNRSKEGKIRFHDRPATTPRTSLQENLTRANNMVGFRIPSWAARG